MSRRFFLTFKDGWVDHQGEILAEESPGMYLVQYHEWVLGYPSNSALVSLNDMKDWKFYRTEELWQQAGSDFYAAAPEANWGKPPVTETEQVQS